jgi:hypothetical protein
MLTNGDVNLTGMTKKIKPKKKKKRILVSERPLW